MIPPRCIQGTTTAGRGHRLAACMLLVATTTVDAADIAAALADRPEAAAAALPQDPLARTPPVDPATTGPDAERILSSLLPRRSDSPADWFAPLEPLHLPGEPRLLSPCVPPPPCHPAAPPQPFDLVGVQGAPTCGPRYGGPCAPRTGSHDAASLPRLHRVPDRIFDRFYRSR